ncbi:MAG: dTMP kinase [Bifidobacteriaceae bacterium]|nr:dTMP kinase [Bifidobacteriaceae bacterium]
MSGTGGAGLFVSFEGIDGVGKTTQVELLRGYLEGIGRAVSVTREPGGTPLGVAIRQLLLSNATDSAPVSPRAEAMLYAADRAQHAHDVIRPALEAGEVVITDRYVDSSIAYQAGGRQLSEDDILMLSMWATQDLMPARTYLLDLDPRVSRTRLSGAPDRLESEPDAFQVRTRQAFLERAEADPQRFRVIDAGEGIDDVWNAVRTDIEELLAS